MSFLIEMAESSFGLTEDEKATVTPALPYLKELVDSADLDWDVIQQGLNLVVKGKPVLDRMITDLRVLGPAASKALGEGMPDIFSAGAAAKDISATVEANPVWVKALKDHGTKLGPLIHKFIEVWPHISPALTVVVAAAKRKGVL